MNLFKKIFGGKSQPSKAVYIQKFTTEPYNFQTITEVELTKKNDELNELYLNNSDGYLIKNFLSEAEVDTIMSQFNRVLADDPAYTDVGFTYPTVFAEFSGRMKSLTEEQKLPQLHSYFAKSSGFNSKFYEDYGVDVKHRFESLFSAISGGRTIEVASGFEEKGHYPFSTFRYLIPEKGLMSVHCGNYFGKTFQNFYKDLTKKVAVENQMSFFIMLQEPERGGELSLFNFKWKDGQTKTSPSEDNEIIQPDGTKLYVENNPNIKKDKIVPKKGDMILFQGGRIWHRVEMVKGAVPRITFGGFLAPSLDGNKYYYWS